jgi:hypothetical protein
MYTSVTLSEKKGSHKFKANLRTPINSSEDVTERRFFSDTTISLTSVVSPRLLMHPGPLAHVVTCSGITKCPDGEITSCQCRRMIPRPDQQPNDPHNCRDCGHTESCHPTPELSTASEPTSSRKTEVERILDEVRPKVKELREQATDDKARVEAYAGFRKDSQGGSKTGEVKNQGGNTKFTV